MRVFEYSHIGKKQNQEDSYKILQNAFMICDGIGSRVNGEIASSFVLDYISEELPDTINRPNLENLLIEVQEALNETYGDQATADGMGTTFAGIFLAPDSLYFTYIGNTRIYWVKPGSGKVWHTWDHSLIGDLMRANEISREAAKNHPMSKKSSKAITVNKNGKTVKPDIYKADFVEENDLFFICSDGMTEVWEEDELVNLLLSEELDSFSKFEEIKHRAIEQSADNNTAILIEIGKDKAFKTGVNEEIIWADSSEFRIDGDEIDVSKEFLKKKKNRKNEEGVTETKKTLSKAWFLTVGVFILGISLLLIFGRDLFNLSKTRDDNRENVPIDINDSVPSAIDAHFDSALIDEIQQFPQEIRQPSPVQPEAEPVRIKVPEIEEPVRDFPETTETLKPTHPDRVSEPEIKVEEIQIPVISRDSVPDSKIDE